MFFVESTSRSYFNCMIQSKHWRRPILDRSSFTSKWSSKSCVARNYRFCCLVYIRCPDLSGKKMGWKTETRDDDTRWSAYAWKRVEWNVIYGVEWVLYFRSQPSLPISWGQQHKCIYWFGLDTRSCIDSLAKPHNGSIDSQCMVL